MLELYGHPFSSYFWKARIALLANETEHVVKMLDPGHPDNCAFVANASPGGKFPVLRDGDKVVFEATAIIEHIAVHHPGIAPLIPADPSEAAEARMMDRVFDNYFQSPLQQAVAAWIAGNGDGDEVAAPREALGRSYRWLEGKLGEWQIPSHYSIVTCSAAPALFYADWIAPIPGDCPRVAALRAELLALPAVVEVVDAARPFRKLFPPGAPDRD